MNTHLKRWTTGHYLFISLIQGTLISLCRFENNLKAGNASGAQEELFDAAALLEASSFSMKFAADFSRDNYMNIIRPSMPNRFSGLDSSDHNALVSQMKALRPYFLDLPDGLSDAKEAFDNALAKAYEAHAYVCDQFVQEQSSLRTKASASPAREVLTNFKRKRLSTIDADLSKLSIEGLPNE